MEQGLAGVAWKKRKQRVVGASGTWRRCEGTGVDPGEGQTWEVERGNYRLVTG